MSISGSILFLFCGFPLAPRTLHAKVASVSVALVAGTAASLFGVSAHAVTTTLLPATAQSQPFFAAVADLSAAGYAEDEFLVQGLANIYEYDEDLDLKVQSSAVPYATRILVRRPVNPRKFNGVVVFEMLNPTAGFDIDFMWQVTQSFLMEKGYIWVGVTIRENAIAFMKNWDPARYGALDLPERGQSYDAYGDIAALFKDPHDDENPLRDYSVTHILGTGYSQSEDWLTTFSNELHDGKIAVDGRPAFDGYLGAGGNGAARGINAFDPDALFGAFYDDERRLNRVAVPYFRIQSETEVDVFAFAADATRQPDSSVFRQWEVAGISHADGPMTALVSEVLARDFGAPLPACDAPQGDAAFAPYIRAALHHLTRWVVRGKRPPASLYLTLDGPGDVARDEFGNARGGLRTPEVEAPLGTYLPSNTGPGPCALSGTFIPFEPSTLDALYPSRRRYLKRVRRSVRRLRRSGYLLPADARAYREAARRRDFDQ